MELIPGSETSTHLIQTPGIYPKENILHDKAYFTSVHFLVHYTNVNIPLLPGSGIHGIQRCCKDNYEELLPALHSFVMDYLTPWGRVPSDTLIICQLLESLYTFCGTQDSSIASQERATSPHFEPNESSQHPLTFWRRNFSFKFYHTPYVKCE
jgi:hypothetical protein